MRYAIIIGVLLIAAPLTLRASSGDPFPDAQSYEGLRNSELGNYDPLYSKQYFPTLSDRIFSILPPQVVLIVLAAITLIAISLVFPKEAFILLFVTSPAFIATFTTVKEAALGITIISVAVLLLRKKIYWALIAIPLCFTLSFALGIISGVAFIAIALIDNKPLLALSTSFLCLISGIISVLLLPTRSLGLRVPSLQELTGVFGYTDGVTVFLLFLGAIGFILTWRLEARHEHWLAFLLVLCGLFFDHGTILFAIVLAYYSANAWHALFDRDWHFKELQSLTLVLIVCGILFTTITIEKQRIAIDASRFEAIQFVNAAYPKGTQIYADEQIAPLLAYNGYPADKTLQLPKNPSFIASTLRDKGYRLIITKEVSPPFGHFPLAYREENGYTVYSVPSE